MRLRGSRRSAGLPIPRFRDRRVAPCHQCGDLDLGRQRREAGQQERLTAQEPQVAELAAAGLSNKEIAGRLRMSPRTVSAHLYRIVPKLGISSRRAALRDALGGPGAQTLSSGPRRAGVQPVSSSCW
jgi:DNA-binding CsgD family transcriptional regulator